MASNWHDISNLLYSGDKDLINIHPLTKHVAQLKYRKKLSRAGMNRATQVVVYSFVTR